MIRYAVVILLMASSAFGQDAGTAAWTPVYEVFSHPRCTNCHVGQDNVPMWSGSSYGAKPRSHGMNSMPGEAASALPPATFAEAPDTTLLARIEDALSGLSGIIVHRGATWTTDAPYRETEASIASARGLGALAVEMEAAALYAFAATTHRCVVCFAHVTNAMAQTEGDFEKGEADGTTATLAVIAAAVHVWTSSTVDAGS